MDLTHDFKAAVLAQKVQLKSKAPNTKEETFKQQQMKRNVKVQKQRDDFAHKARTACHNITTLRNFLLENRAAYKRIGYHLKSSARMTDEQRDLIDREAEKFFIYYIQYLAQYRADCLKDKHKTPQQRQYMEAVCDLLSSYLSRVQQLYLEQKKYRVQYELDTYNMLKLAPDTKNLPICAGGNMRKPRAATYASSDSGADSETDESHLLSSNRKSMSNTSTNEEGSKLRHRFKRRRRSENENKETEWSMEEADLQAEGRTLSPASRQMAVDEDLQKSQQEQPADAALSAEDAQLFEQENEALYQELQGVAQEIEAIEKNVTEIAHLQDIFSEKVTSQQYNIERIANTVVGATENVKDANEQIRRAIQRNAGLRVWSLFFLLVMSFTLLFLDWYYD